MNKIIFLKRERLIFNFKLYIFKFFSKHGPRINNIFKIENKIIRKIKNECLNRTTVKTFVSFFRKPKFI